MRLFRRRQRRLTPCLGSTLLALGLAWGCSSGDAPELGPTARVEQGRLERLVVATGTIEPESEVEVRPRISGIVEEIHVEPGDVVQAEQPLLEIDRELLEVQAEEAKAQLDAAKVERHYATTALERARALHARDAMAEQELEDAQSRFDTAQTNVARARARLNSLRVQLRHATVVSNIAATVLDVYVEEGSAVSAVTAPTGGSRLLSLAQTDALHLEGLVDENEVAGIRVGQPARVRTEAFADTVFEGRVRKISPIGERRENVTYFEVEIEIVGERSRLRPRMSADADVVTEVIEDALWIPETALLYDGDRIYVEVVDATPEGFTQRDVTLGVLDHDRVQVVSGLDLGDEVRLK